MWNNDSLNQPELLFEVQETKKPNAGAKMGELQVTASAGAELSPAQVEFNKLMKRLENTRTKKERERRRLDGLLSYYVAEVMPLVARANQLNWSILQLSCALFNKTKFTARRKESLADLLWHKGQELLGDGHGLSAEELEAVRTLTEPLHSDDPEQDAAEFMEMREMVEHMAQACGVELDLSGIELTDDTEEVERKIYERFDEAMAKAGQAPPADTHRPTKAQLAREKKKLELEEAKRRDLKSLYKQLAKVLHPDLETDSAKKLQKEEWMKRLTTAHANNDLRELLSIEMEWLGVEANNLASASDQKLKVYSAVLKEQIAEIQRQTEDLLNEPEYMALGRFRSPFSGVVPLPEYVVNDFTLSIQGLEEMLSVLELGGKRSQQMLNKWADHHARSFGF
jgi:hypothetical protein